jgi:hypothetical protein
MEYFKIPAPRHWKIITWGVFGRPSPPENNPKPNLIKIVTTKSPQKPCQSGQAFEIVQVQQLER